METKYNYYLNYKKNTLDPIINSFDDFTNIFNPIYNKMVSTQTNIKEWGDIVINIINLKDTPTV